MFDWLEYSAVRVICTKCFACCNFVLNTSRFPIHYSVVRGLVPNVVQRGMCPHAFFTGRRFVSGIFFSGAVTR